MIQDTSKEAYVGISAELGHRQRQVLDAFKQFGPHTNLEISRLLGLPINQVTPRTNELVKMGCLQSTIKRRCTISKKNAIVWSTSPQPTLL